MPDKVLSGILSFYIDYYMQTVASRLHKAYENAITANFSNRNKAIINQVCARLHGRFSTILSNSH